MKCHDCNMEMTRADFKTATIHYCDCCFDYKIEQLECEHDYVPMLFLIGGGAEQVRLFCNKCKRLSKDALKKADFDLSKMPLHNLAKYHEWYDQYTADDSGNIRDFIAYIKDAKDNTETILPGIDPLTRREIYEQYINSEEWRNIRSQRLNIDAHVCQICGELASDVHHLTYKHFRNEYLFELVSLCHYCHITKYNPHKKIKQNG